MSASREQHAEVDPRRWMRRSIRHLRPYYKAPRERLLRMDQNTNLHGRNPAIDTFAGAERFRELEFNQYPTRDADDLVGAIETRHGLPAGSVLCGNGSDEVLDIICKTFTEPGESIAVVAPSYSLYPFYAALNGLEFVEVPLTEGWELDVDALIDANAKLTLVANPNNPTGGTLPADELFRLLDGTDGIVVLDEAYIEYADDGSTRSLLPEVAARKDLIVMRTFSKAYGLAGARLGWLAAHPATTELLSIVKPPFNVNVMTEALALEALREDAFVREGVAEVKRERERLRGRLERLGFEVLPSQANFLLTLPPASLPDGPSLCDLLRAEGIATRVFPERPRLERSIRFTIGRPEDNDRLIETIEALSSQREESR